MGIDIDKKIVRWVGAFRNKRIPLYNSLIYELQNTSKEVAATSGLLYLYRGFADVGLEVRHSAIIRSFKGDVWSEYDDDGKLYPTRHSSETQSSHSEYFCHPNYVGFIIVRRATTPHRIKVVERVAKKFDMRIRYV